MLRPLILSSLFETFLSLSWIKADNSSFTKEIHELVGKSSEKMNSHLHDQDFQGWMSDIQRKSCQISSDWLSLSPACSPPLKNSGKTPLSPELKQQSFYIFVSLSMGKKALLNLAEQAKEFGGTLVLRGFIEGSYKKTVSALQHIIRKTGQGFIVDPELFEIFQIKAVPTFILTSSLNLSDEKKTPLHDRIQGHVTLSYALQKIFRDGDLKDIAKAMLKGRNQGK